MDKLDTREWLLTNGLGSFASGTVCDAHTRTYHGWLIAALEPPGARKLLLSHINALLEVGGQSFELGVKFWKSGAVAPQGFRFLQSFQSNPVPTWTWGQSNWQLSRRLLMPYGVVTKPVEPIQFRNRLLMQYSYHGTETAVLKLSPLIGDRSFHRQQFADEETQFIQTMDQTGVLLQAKRADQVGTPWRLDWTQGNYEVDGLWYWGYRYPEETQRGLADIEDLYSPGCLHVVLAPGTTVTLAASVGLEAVLLDDYSFDRAITAEQTRLAQAFAAVPQVQWLDSSGDSKSSLNHNLSSESSKPEADSDDANIDLLQRLLIASDRFIVYRASMQGPTMIAGYPWFNDWGRDTLIALPGLTLSTGRLDLAKGLLRTFGQYCHQGLIPNTFLDGGEPFYNSVDAALWWIESLGLYLEASQDWAFLAEQYPIVWRIYKGLMAGTLYSIRVDAFDGLVTWNAPHIALTWMDAIVAEEPVTPRRGKPVEISALWYSALCWAHRWAERLQHMPDQGLTIERTVLAKQARRYLSQAELVKASLQKYWNPTEAYLYDTLDPSDYPDRIIRPNAVIALSLRHCGFSNAIGRQVLQVAQQRLLTPYGLRSLDPADAQYVGQYRGGIWQRDRAYHQGMVWPWLLGPFTRAWQRFCPTEPLPFDWQILLQHFQHQACLETISEMFEADPPHQPKGAFAQAWSVAEILRHGIGLYG